MAKKTTTDSGGAAEVPAIINNNKPEIPNHNNSKCLGQQSYIKHTTEMSDDKICLAIRNRKLKRPVMNWIFDKVIKWPRRTIVEHTQIHTHTDKCMRERGIMILVVSSEFWTAAPPLSVIEVGLTVPRLEVLDFEGTMLTRLLYWLYMGARFELWLLNRSLEMSKISVRGNREMRESIVWAMDGFW